MSDHAAGNEISLNRRQLKIGKHEIWSEKNELTEVKPTGTNLLQRFKNYCHILIDDRVYSLFNH